MQRILIQRKLEWFGERRHRRLAILALSRLGRRRVDGLSCGGSPVWNSLDRGVHGRRFVVAVVAENFRKIRFAGEWDFRMMRFDVVEKDSRIGDHHEKRWNNMIGFVGMLEH